jgi:FMN reductase
VTTRTLAVIAAGLTQPSSTRLLADRLAAATETELSRLGIEHRTTVIDLRQHGRDVMNNLLAGFPTSQLKAVVDTVAGADGLIAVTPIFNASYSGLFKSFVDILDERSLVDKPVLIAATGGTARHSLALEHALRPLFVYLHAVVVPTSVYAAPEDWAGGPDPNGGGPLTAPLHRRVGRAARELAVSMSQREPRPAADPFALTTSFSDLVAGS